jgi:hypothetical protein
MIRIGPRARIHGIRPELGFANLVLYGILAKYDAIMTIGHALDGTHARASIHYAGGAEDLSFASELELDVKRQIIEEWQQSVGPDFDIIFEDPGGPKEHAHAEFQPKEPYK